MTSPQEIELTDVKSRDDTEHMLVSTPYTPESVACNNWWKLSPGCFKCWNCFPAPQLRRAVSQNKKRFTRDGFDLDLTYLTDQVVIFGFPSIGLEHMYRNPRSEVARLFEQRHKGKYFIYNFCCETGRAYDPAVFDGRVQVYPFEDHGVPKLSMMVDFCDAAARWLSGDPENVVGVHCKAGKGRSGLMACCLFQRLGLADSAESAILMYNQRRVRNMKGLTVPSQRRYVKYYEMLLARQRSGITPVVSQPTLTLKLIRFTHPVAASKAGVLRIYQGETAHRHNLIHAVEVAAGSTSFALPNVQVTGNVGMIYSAGGKTKLDIWFNTQFVTGNVLVISKLEVDKFKSDFQHHKAPMDFQVVFAFQPSVAAPAPPAGSAPALAGPVGLELVPHQHTDYCDRKDRVCTASGQFREGETVNVITQDAEPVSVYWYRTGGDSVGDGDDDTKTDSLADIAADEAKDEIAPNSLKLDDGTILFRVFKEAPQWGVFGTMPAHLQQAGDVDLSAENASATIYQQVRTAAADPRKYMLTLSDVGHQLLARCMLPGRSSPVMTSLTPVIQAGPPKVREAWLEGSCVVGERLKAGYWYFGGVPGVAQLSWLRVDADGNRVLISSASVNLQAPVQPSGEADDPRFYTLTAADVGCNIKVQIVPTRDDGDQGYPTTSKPSAVVKA